MNAKHRKTLAAIFAKEIPRNLPFRDIESLFNALDCRLKEGGGSHVTYLRGSATFDAHRPHPGKEAKPYQIRDARWFLTKIGVKP